MDTFIYFLIGLAVGMICVAILCVGSIIFKERKDKIRQIEIHRSYIDVVGQILARFDYNRDVELPRSEPYKFVWVILGRKSKRPKVWVRIIYDDVGPIFLIESKGHPDHADNMHVLAIRDELQRMGYRAKWEWAKNYPTAEELSPIRQSC